MGVPILCYACSLLVDRFYETEFPIAMPIGGAFLLLTAAARLPTAIKLIRYPTADQMTRSTEINVHLVAVFGGIAIGFVLLASTFL